MLGVDNFLFWGRGPFPGPEYMSSRDEETCLISCDGRNIFEEQSRAHAGDVTRRSREVLNPVTCLHANT